MPEMNKSATMLAETDRKDQVDALKNRGREAAAGAERLVDMAKEKATVVKDAAKEKLSDAATAAGELAVQVKDKVQEWGAVATEETRDAALEAAREVTNLVRRYPIQSLVVGVAVGYLVARATTRS
jgi:ElaB/YqjD/DUF883 family membrane-anchored ribosome-binding protein